jgi:hypothetical protein
MSFCHSGIVLLPRATEALLKKVKSHIKMSYVKTEHREVIDCLRKYDLTCVPDLNILILIDILWTHKPLL